MLNVTADYTRTPLGTWRGPAYDQFAAVHAAIASSGAPAA
jgi:hypothetical protein